jgi:hypothetical protein
MSKYTSLINDVFSVFSSEDWLLEGINTVPSNFVPDGIEEFVRVSVVPASFGVNFQSTSGVLIATIFVPAGYGPKSYMTIADTLDRYLVGKTFSSGSGGSTQFTNSSTLRALGEDAKTPTFYAAEYTIPFSYFGVI